MIYIDSTLLCSSGALEREDDRSRERAEEKFLAGMERLLDGGNKGSRSRMNIEYKRGGIVEKLGESACAGGGEETEIEEDFRGQKEHDQGKEKGRNGRRDMIQLI